MKTSLSGHQSARMISDVWLTPQTILAPLGKFDLDPCTIATHPWPIAPKFYTLEEDGLTQDWKGRVWLNPPFGKEWPKWLEKLSDHPGGGIALIAARTETKAFFELVWWKADAICFVEGRPHFHRPDGTRAKSNSGAPICLVAYGEANALCLHQCGLGRTMILDLLNLEHLIYEPKQAIRPINSPATARVRESSCPPDGNSSVWGAVKADEISKL